MLPCCPRCRSRRGVTAGFTLEIAGLLESAFVSDHHPITLLPLEDV